MVKLIDTAIMGQTILQNRVLYRCFISEERLCLNPVTGTLFYEVSGDSRINVLSKKL